jgi:hypothetical protein
MFLYIKAIYLSPEHWSQLLFGDTNHDLLMQIIIENLSTPDLFLKATKQFGIVIRHAGTSSEHLLHLEDDFKYLSKITYDDNEECYLNASIITQLLDYIKTILTELIKFQMDKNQTS